MKKRSVLAFVTLGASVGLFCGQVYGQALIPHRAVYELNLLDAKESSGIVDVNGRIVYEFKGSQCEGYAVNFRAVTEFKAAETTNVIDQQVETYENLEKDIFNFASKSYLNFELDKESKGSAHKSGEGIAVELLKPDRDELGLVLAKFPTAHMREVIDHALKGEHFFETTLYDGMEQGNKVYTTTVVIGDLRVAQEGEREVADVKSLQNFQYWPVSIAYFEDANPQDDSAPSYSMDFKLYENGVARDIKTDYGDFRILGRLVSLDFLEAKTCE